MPETDFEELDPLAELSAELMAQRFVLMTLLQELSQIHPDIARSTLESVDNSLLTAMRQRPKNDPLRQIVERTVTDIFDPFGVEPDFSI